MRSIEGLDVDAVALTIDAGADVDNLKKELDILEEKHVHATVFLYTRYLAARKDGPEVVKRILADGNELGNHTQSHPDLTKRDEGDVAREIDAVETFVENATGGTTRPYFRPPFLATNAKVERVVKAHCYRPVWITVDSRDDRPNANAQDIVNAILGAHNQPSHIRRGDILLFHGSQTEDLVALPKIIDGLRERGFSILTLTDALRRAEPVSQAKGAR